MAVFTVFVTADNQVFITQSGTNAQIEIDQIGEGNLVGGNESPSGTPISGTNSLSNNEPVEIIQPVYQDISNKLLKQMML